MNISQACIDLVKEFEGFRNAAYQDQGGIWTIGYGHTQNVKAGDVCTQEQAERWLSENIQTAAQCVLNNLTCSLSQNELDALACFTYNVGCKNFINSTMRLYLDRNQFTQAALEFQKWDHVNGQVIPGLFRRRVAEKMLFLGNNFNAAGS